MEHLSEVVVISGLILAALAYAWLVVLGWERGVSWGFGVLLLPPIAIPLLVTKEPRRAGRPLALLGIGCLVALVAWLCRRPELVKQWKIGGSTWMASEQGAFLLLVAGLSLLLLGFLALVVAAFRVRTLWGVGILVFPPLGLVFTLRYWSRSRMAAALFLVGLIVGGTPFVITRYLFPIDLGPRERIVNGERHITLTGWDRHDYGFLSAKPDLVVLQMANRDVNDGTIRLLSNLAKLRDLDIEGTGITDRSLQILASLPALQTLRLKDTKITDSGFRDTIGASTTLRMIDLRGTAVTAETVQSWRQTKPGRRAMR